MSGVTRAMRRARDWFAALANGAPGAGFLTEGAIYVGVDVSQHLAALATIPFVFMYLSAHDLGVITAAVVVTSFASLSSVALDFTVIRQYYQVAEDRRPELVSVAFTVTLAVAAAVAGSAVLLLRYGGSAMVPTVLGLLTGVFLAMRSIPLSVARVRGEFRTYALLTAGSGWLQAVAQSVSLVVNLGLVGFLSAALLVSGITAIASYVLIRPHTRCRVLPLRAWRHDALRYALKVFPSVCLSRLVLFADRLALMAWTNFDSLGIYGAASRFSTPLKLVTGGLKMALAPAMSRQERDGQTQPAALDGMVLSMVSITLALGMLVLVSTHLVSFTLWREHVVTLQQLLTFLIAAQILGGLIAVGQTQILFSARPAAATWTTAAHSITLGVALVMLVPAAAEQGAAIAELLAGLVAVITMTFVVMRFAGVAVQTWATVALLVTSFLVPAVAVWFIRPGAQLLLWTAFLFGYVLVLVHTLSREFHARSAATNVV